MRGSEHPEGEEAADPVAKGAGRERPGTHGDFETAVQQGLADLEAGRVVDDQAIGHLLDARFGRALTR